MVAFQLFSGIAFVLLLVPYPLQLRSGNAALICYTTWLLLYVLITFVNSSVWAKTDAIIAPVWGDISTKLQVGAQVALPTCSLAILRKLEAIASTRTVSTTKEDKRRDTVIDLILGVAIPASYMITHVAVQGHRYDIIQGYGPQYTLYRCWLALFIFTLPPLVFILMASIYAGLSLRWFLIRRRQFRAVLLSRAGGLTTSRFIRLLILTSVEMVISLPAQIINAYYTLAPTEYGDSFPLAYPSWEYVHAGFGRIGQTSLAELKAYDPTFLPVAEFLRWAVVLGAFCAFGCLGLSSENVSQLRTYSTALTRLVTRKSRSAPRETQVTMHIEQETITPVPAAYDYDEVEKGLYELKTTSPGSTASFGRDRFLAYGSPTLSVSGQK